MCQNLRLLGIACLACLSACSKDAQYDPLALLGPDVAVVTMSDAEDAPTMGQIGQVQYGFDPNRLTRAEIQVMVPPRYQESVWATKLFPRERVAELGKEDCRYGQSDRRQVCTVELEDGLAMALLEHPIGDYRRELLDGQIPPDQLRPDRIAGVDGFSYVANEVDLGLRYRFFPIDDRTLMLVMRADTSQDKRDLAIEDVLHNLALMG